MKYAAVVALLAIALALVGTAAAGKPKHGKNAPTTCGVYLKYSC
jgi:hypothetical protein